jgi:hypothetical protein
MPYQRIVCFKFKKNASPQAIQRHMDSFKAMQQHIPQILSYSGGRATSGDLNRPPDYDTMHYLIFASPADIDIYFHHPAHQRFIEENKAIWDKVFVLAATIEE